MKKIYNFIRNLLKRNNNKPTWHNHLIWCPSQCNCYFKSNGKKYCIYLRWRHNDPWTSQVVPCDDDWEFLYDHDWEDLDIPHFSAMEYPKLQKKCIKIVEKLFINIIWCYGNNRN